MASTSIHQAVHGYRDGHRLLSSSTPLGSDASRAMLVMSDMSGPSMQPGFDEYLTAYSLAGTDYFVLAKTWYAPEMQRPGCVWTHSLLVPRARVASMSAARLTGNFRRPQVDGVDAAATSPVLIDEEAPVGGTGDGFADKGLAATMIGAVLGQPRPVIVLADTAAQFEAVFLRLWEELWPAERTRFSFCTGALMPRANSIFELRSSRRSGSTWCSTVRRVATRRFGTGLKLLQGRMPGVRSFPGSRQSSANGTPPTRLRGWSLRAS